MKNIVLFTLLIAVSGFSQSINDYQYVIVPVKFEFQKKENQYRLNTLTKHNLNAIGFTSFYDNQELPADLLNNRCDKLYVNVERKNAFLSIKLLITFKDCKNNIIFTSETGASKIKEFEPAYHQALNAAFESVKQQNYSYNGTRLNTIAGATIAVDAVKTKEAPLPISPSAALKAEATTSGYLLIDESTSKIVMRLQKTSDPKVFLANQQEKQGMVIEKDNQWFFEHYENNVLISEKLNVTF